jgi:hypothetical protein
VSELWLFDVRDDLAEISDPASHDVPTKSRRVHNPASVRTRTATKRAVRTTCCQGSMCAKSPCVYSLQTDSASVAARFLKPAGADRRIPHTAESGSNSCAAAGVQGPDLRRGEARHLRRSRRPSASMRCRPTAQATRLLGGLPCCCFRVDPVVGRARPERLARSCQVDFRAFYCGGVVAARGEDP